MGFVAVSWEDSCGRLDGSRAWRVGVACGELAALTRPWAMLRFPLNGVLVGGADVWLESRDARAWRVGVGVASDESAALTRPLAVVAEPEGE